MKPPNIFDDFRKKKIIIFLKKCKFFYTTYEDTSPNPLKIVGKATSNTPPLLRRSAGISHI